MPSREFYQVANKDEGEAAQADQSYRSCVLALLIFFFLCIILILVSLPWKRNHTYDREYQDDNWGITQRHHYGHKHHAGRTTSTTESTYLNNDTFLNKSVELEITSEFEVSTQNFNVINITNSIYRSTEFKELVNVETSTKQEISTSTVTDKQLYEVSSTNVNSLLENVNATDTSTSNLTTEKYEENVNRSEIDTTQLSTSTDINFVNKMTFSDSYEITTDNVIELTTKDEESTIIETTTDNVIESVTKNEESTITEITDYVLNATTDFTTISTVQNSTTGRPITTTPWDLFNENLCLTGECKNIASKMLFYMNHTADPCEDFYEYACGGFEANPQTIEVDLENAAYQRILRQAQEDIDDEKSRIFTKYYNSCMQYENVDFIERIKLAKEVLDNVGKFYTVENWPQNHTDFTELVGTLLLHNSALLFDIAPDLNEYSPKVFTLKIGPATLKNPFETEETEDDPCYANRYERDQETVDLGKLYREYKTCKNNTETFINSITEALKALGVFNELSNSYNISQHVHTTVINIDFELVQNFFANYPTKDKIREAYLMKNYTRVSIEDLQANFGVIDWTRLIFMLTKEKIQPEVNVQVYFYDALVQGLKNLEAFEAKDAIGLNNALLGLYAHDVYHKFVLSKHTIPKEQCLRTAVNVLIPEASSLYISSFSNDEILYMNITIRSLFEKLKETLKLKVEQAEWVAEGRNTLVAKINDLKVTIPDISYFTNSTSIYRKTRANKVVLSDNYFKNSVTLMKRNRNLTYAELFTNPGNPEQIWTHYATPFQSKGLAIYGLNLIVIPFGVIDWSTKYNQTQFDYIIFGTLGNVIAHQIAHHFDANGIYYWNGTRDAKYSLLNDDSTNLIFEEYIYCQRNNPYGSPINMMIPSTGQNVSYEISQLTLNERLSETMGLRLAYDTLHRLRSSKEVLLPWLELASDQLFYLTYAQMHCAKSPFTSSYISLYEDEQLPSRVRIFVSASNSRFLGGVWKCAEGSGILPSHTCNVFPYLELSDTTSVPATRK
ncbi:endothelin-converting enzyme 1 isoform X1 [Colletes latitarsis]|uniref:endothelin-converting enzyme 1 isoform X1 n=1 Tax=Colletes latitarsis TaxID=2605962 RepID=UPI00403607BC